MNPRMTPKELELFVAFIRNSQNYVEFGSGGSTYIASKFVKKSILSVDSSQEWLDDVSSACAESGTKPHTLYVDIGPIREWGIPTDPSSKDKWPAYSEGVWAIEGSQGADLYMVDGRFRVACFAQIILHCLPNAMICFHDFASRIHYHSVYEIAREVATVEDLSIFLPLNGARDAATKLLQEYRFNPS